MEMDTTNDAKAECSWALAGAQMNGWTEEGLHRRCQTPPQCPWVDLAQPSWVHSLQPFPKPGCCSEGLKTPPDCVGRAQTTQPEQSKPAKCTGGKLTHGKEKREKMSTSDRDRAAHSTFTKKSSLCPEKYPQNRGNNFSTPEKQQWITGANPWSCLLAWRSAHLKDTSELKTILLPSPGKSRAV